MQITFRGTVWTLVVLIVLAALYYGVARKWGWLDRPPPDASTVRQEKPVPLPTGAKPPAPVEKPWEPNAARNARDLYAAFEKAAALDRPDAWLVAADIADTCFGSALDPMWKSQITREIGEWNSTKAGQPDRVAKLAQLGRRQAALTELETRCKGFSGRGRPWIVTTVRTLRNKAADSNSDVGRLLRAGAEARDGGGKVSDREQAVAAALKSGNPVLTRMALIEMSQSLYDRSMNPPPAFSAVGALTAAWARITGPDFDSNELETLALCVNGYCEKNDPYVTPAGLSETYRAVWENVVEQYEQALRAGDVKKVLAVKPS